MTRGFETLEQRIARTLFNMGIESVADAKDHGIRFDADLADEIDLWLGRLIKVWERENGGDI